MKFWPCPFGHFLNSWLKFIESPFEFFGLTLFFFRSKPNLGWEGESHSFLEPSFLLNSVSPSNTSIHTRNLNYLNLFFTIFWNLLLYLLWNATVIHLEDLASWFSNFLFIITALQPEFQVFVLYCFLKLETSTFPTIQLPAFPFEKLKPCQFYKVLTGWIMWTLSSQFHSLNLIWGKVFVLLIDMKISSRILTHISHWLSQLM